MSCTCPDYFGKLMTSFLKFLKLLLAGNTQENGGTTGFLFILIQTLTEVKFKIFLRTHSLLTDTMH